ncbi:DUF1080 domain-containing protein [Halobacteria archaeon AArc-dxtr1]|nr:DUF1080 domain-containing protein [Halobacteria archaeon AArc-dxtr1]
MNEPTDNQSLSAERRRILQSVGGLGIAGLAGCLGDDDEENGDDANGDDADDPNGNGEDNPWDEYDAPDDTPESVVPGSSPLNVGAEAPEDATILWDGENATLDDWVAFDSGGEPAEWDEHDDYFEVDLGTGDISTEEELGDCHVHVEYRVPEEYEGFVDIDEGGDGQGPGNSGVFLMETYEVQVLQSYNNPTYPSGYSGSFYTAGAGEGGAVPKVLPANPPGEWNAFDIIWRNPRFNEDNELERYPQLTVFWNGVAVVNHYDVPGPNWWVDVFEDEFDNDTNPHPMDDDGNFLDEAPLRLQDHGADYDECHFRNIWFRDLPESPVEDGDDDLPYYESTRGVWEERDEYDGHEDSWDPDHPDQPDQIEPGTESGAAPEDADVLIDGEETLAAGDGDWESGEEYGDCQVHVEWQADADADAMGPWRSNSGLQIGDYEIQIVDTDDNPVEAEEWAGAYTDQVGPDWDAVTESGEWQSMDVIFQGPGDDQDAQATVFVNGVIVQARLLIDEANVDADHGDMEIRLAEPPEDGSDVHFRNTWARSLIH